MKLAVADQRTNPRCTASSPIISASSGVITYLAVLLGIKTKMTDIVASLQYLKKMRVCCHGNGHMRDMSMCDNDSKSNGVGMRFIEV